MNRKEFPFHHKVLLTGATGYVGGRLLHRLESLGVNLRCLARRPEFLRPKVASSTKVVEGDLLDVDSLHPAMDGVRTAYYLVHSMGSKGDFEEQDRKAARNFASAASQAGVRRIIYLGGLGRDEELSTHLASRHEVGRILQSSGVETIEFRASIIIGSGSLSFELIRALVDKLPIMITPRWVRETAQPIAIDDVLTYLIEALDIDSAGSRVFEVGGPDQVSYQGLMKEYARQKGLKRRVIPVPVLTPRLSSLWLGLVTPVFARIGRKLVDSLRNATVVEDSKALEVFQFRPRGIRQAIKDALANEERKFAESRWSDALSSKGPERGFGGVRFGSRIIDSQSVEVSLAPKEAFKLVERIGGETGWYYADWLWTIRGFLDLLVGGVGVRRGRRHPTNLGLGDTVDFWRVEAFTPGRLIRLFAEMKFPASAWLQYEDAPVNHGSIIRQTAIFDPLGLLGLSYWYLLYPLHQLVFSGTLCGIKEAAEKFVGKPERKVSRDNRTSGPPFQVRRS
jgi:uncharacterized protein YbjT (DUF2867 family)